jgi:hypothetical protein
MTGEDEGAFSSCSSSGGAVEIAAGDRKMAGENVSPPIVTSPGLSRTKAFDR